MTTHAIREAAHHAGAPRLPRFVLVNERVPRANACCASCCTTIERGYVRDPQTRLLYCDAQCFAEHERTSGPAGTRHARRVS
jgi:hypothetical protein